MVDARKYPSVTLRCQLPSVSLTRKEGSLFFSLSTNPSLHFSWKEIPLLGEMSALADKRVPVFRRKRWQSEALTEGFGYIKCVRHTTYLILRIKRREPVRSSLLLFLLFFFSFYSLKALILSRRLSP